MKRRANRTAVAMLSTFVALAVAAGAAPSAGAQQGKQTLLINTHEAGRWVYGGLHYRGEAWWDMTRLLDAKYGSRLTVAPTLNDRAALLKYDALWVDQRWHHTPDANEIDNIMAFAATGRRVVIIGENGSWGPWNDAILTPLGGINGGYVGDRAPGCAYGPVTAVSDHELTRDVTSVNVECGGFVTGGVSLFDYNVATLWGRRANVLTVLDGNVLDNPFGTRYDGPQFRENVVDWLSAPTVVTTPEPGTVALVAVGLVAVAAAAQRRRAGRD